MTVTKIVYSVISHLYYTENDKGRKLLQMERVKEGYSPPLVTRAPPSVCVLRVSRVAAVRGGVRARFLTSLASLPPRRLVDGGRRPPVRTRSLSSRTRLSRLIPAGGAVELLLSRQTGLDAGRGCSQQTELLQRDDDQQRKIKRGERRGDRKDVSVFPGG